jgi:hypothetical protein
MHFVLLLVTLLTPALAKRYDGGELRDDQLTIFQSSQDGRRHGSQYRWSLYGSNTGLDTGEGVEPSNEWEPNSGLVLDGVSDDGTMTGPQQQESASETSGESLPINKTAQRIKRDISQFYKLCRFGQTPDSNGIDYTIAPQNGSTIATTGKIDEFIDLENISHTFMASDAATPKGKPNTSPRRASIALKLLC